MPAQAGIEDNHAGLVHSVPDARRAGGASAREERSDGKAGFQGVVLFGAGAGTGFWSEASAHRARFGRTGSGHRGGSKSGTRQRGKGGAPASRARVGGKDGRPKRLECEWQGVSRGTEPRSAEVLSKRMRLSCSSAFCLAAHSLPRPPRGWRRHNGYTPHK